MFNILNVCLLHSLKKTNTPTPSFISFHLPLRQRKEQLEGQRFVLRKMQHEGEAGGAAALSFPHVGKDQRLLKIHFTQGTSDVQQKSCAHGQWLQWEFGDLYVLRNILCVYVLGAGQDSLAGTVISLF